jgi:hypothetical protein
MTCEIKEDSGKDTSMSQKIFLPDVFHSQLVYRTFTRLMSSIVAKAKFTIVPESVEIIKNEPKT